MKINGEFMLREVADENILIPVGKTALTFNGMIMMNPTGVMIWNGIKDRKSEEEIIMSITDRYEIDAETAKADYDEFVQGMIREGILKE